MLKRLIKKAVKAIIKTKIGTSMTLILLGMDRRWRKARLWSNKVLQKYAFLFQGEVINISGWKDSDKEGRHYKDYFSNASKYYISNYGLHQIENQNEIALDLEHPLPPELEMRFDVVYNHTTLEHIFLIETAFSNLCRMARDAVIVVVPFAQAVHTSSFFKDYWRFTPCTIEKLFEKNGFSMLICEYDNSFNSSIYLFCIGIRNEKVGDYSDLTNTVSKLDYAAGYSIGRGCKLMEKVVYKLIIPICNRLIQNRREGHGR